MIAPPTLNRPRFKHLLLIVIRGVLIGSVYLAAKIALKDVGPLTISAARSLIAVAVVAPFVVYMGNTFMPRAGRDAGLVAAIAVLSNSIPYFLVAWAVQRLDTGLIAILLATGPFAALMISHLLTRNDRLGTVKGLSMAIGFCGVLVTLWFSGLGFTAKAVSGVAAALAAAGSTALGGVLGHRLSHAPADGLALAVLAAGAALTLPVSLAVEGLPSHGYGWPTMVALFYLGGASTGLVYVLRFRLIKEVGYTFTSYTGYLVPAIGLLLGALYLHEVVNPMMIVGLVVIFAGAWVRMLPRLNGGRTVGVVASAARRAQ